jgi:L-lactate dehydrogenase (cytochrome)/(S)-mandelate dehydrogenase
VTALALGADAVLIGRPYLYGLAVSGTAGVEAVLGILANEARMAMTLMGVAGVSELNREHVVATS